ncbi:hypothetical protein HC026_11025 [Lactobacillus sp. LC28-10]|uniref:Uncharacterized protein n=1 Tax=Secundilactobacillus angelensis TaxID=2722706 RepID=A0ABX1L1V8_9LACO|nr:hypothetical protein [Secundilactobacillus angelensis]MCH5463216.1 hypothetical protein [Secundilactobacillus angelensis]NLR19425.1 hypothetical protein [Secundilactobacillus angelensis]
MKKSILVSLALSAGLIAGVGATSTTASASSWHKGTPKALRGNYQEILHGDFSGYYQGWKITKNKVYTFDTYYKNGEHADVKLTWSHTKYKKIGKYYLVEGKLTPKKGFHDFDLTKDLGFYKKGKHLTLGVGAVPSKFKFHPADVYTQY